MGSYHDIVKNMGYLHLPLLIMWFLALICSRRTTNWIMIVWGFLQAAVAQLLTQYVVYKFYWCTGYGWFVYRKTYLFLCITSLVLGITAVVLGIHDRALLAKKSKLAKKQSSIKTLKSKLSCSLLAIP